MAFWDGDWPTSKWGMKAMDHEVTMRWPLRKYGDCPYKPETAAPSRCLRLFCLGDGQIGTACLGIISGLPPPDGMEKVEPLGVGFELGGRQTILWNILDAVPDFLAQR